MTITAASLAIGSKHPVAGICVFGCLVFWSVGVEYRFLLSPIRLACGIVILNALIGCAFGFVQSLAPPPQGEWLFSPISAAVFCGIIFALSTGFWLLIFVLIWMALKLGKRKEIRETKR
jgi:hypothetical protein